MKRIVWALALAGTVLAGPVLAQPIKITGLR
jgi:branched-chain amino acid transport system substrate-binding protein